MFRTDGLNSVENFWSLRTGANAAGAVERFRVYVPANSSNVGIYSREDLFFTNGAGTTERMRILEPSGNVGIGTAIIPNNVRIRTVAEAINQAGSVNWNTFDIIFQGHVSDDIGSNIRLMNGTNSDSNFVAQLSGYNNRTDNGAATPVRLHGLVVSGAINNSADVAPIPANSPAVMEFDVRRRNGNGNAQAAIANRNLFQWCNFTTLEMLMDGSGQLGINQSTPENRLEITSRAGDPYFGLASGASGLRFTDLTSLSTTLANGTNGVDATKVLSVDENGDVVLVNSSNSVQDAHNGASLSSFDFTKVAFGQTIGQAGNPAILLNTREVPMNNQNIIFTVPGSGPSAAGNNVGFGLSNPTSQIHIQSYQNSGVSVPFRVDNSNAQLSVAIKDNQRIGVGTTNPQASLELKTAPGSFQAPGIVLNSESNFPSNFLTFQQNNVAKFVIGHYDNAFTLGTGSENSPVSYITLNNVSQTVNFNKNVIANNNVDVMGVLTVPSGVVTGSDAMFKTNIVDLTTPLSIINQLQARKYYYDTTSFSAFNFENDMQFGFVAQEIEQVLPNIVNTNTYPAQYDSLGNQISTPVNYKGVEYNEIIPIAVAAIQQLSSENDSLKNVVSNLNDRLTALENCLSALLPTLCQMNQQAIQANTPAAQEQLRKEIAVTLTNRSTIILDQNVPNPFAEQTVINFSIPETVKKAQIHFYNQEGKIIQTVDVLERGLGSVTVFGADLSSGVYTYSLVADGQIVATKKMMKL